VRRRRTGFDSGENANRAFARESRSARGGGRDSARETCARVRKRERERVRPCERKSLVREGSSERNPTLRSGAEGERAVVYPEPHHRSCVCVHTRICTGVCT